MKKLLLVILLYTSIAYSQTDSVYTIPFASTGNTIELAVANMASTSTSNVTVTVTNAPNWIKFDSMSQNQTISQIIGRAEQSAYILIFRR